jgi:hypothetical protein
MRCSVTGPRCGICVPLDQADVTRPPLVSTEFDGNLFYAGTHVAFPRSYLYPAAVLRASFVVFMVSRGHAFRESPLGTKDTNRPTAPTGL